MYRANTRDLEKSRVFAVVSRQVLLESRFSTVICVPVGPTEGLKHESSLHCDELVSLLKSALTDYVGAVSSSKLDELHRALLVALDLN